MTLEHIVFLFEIFDFRQFWFELFSLENILNQMKNFKISRL